MKKFKYYEATVTSRQILKVWMKVPAQIDEDDVWIAAREIDGGCHVPIKEDWELDEVVEINVNSEKMLDKPKEDWELDGDWEAVKDGIIEYIEEDFLP